VVRGLRAAWLGAVLCLVGLVVPRSAQAETLRLWHAYRGDEKAALEALLAQYERDTGVHVETLNVPFDAFLSKLQAAVLHGEGPHLFIDAHNRLGALAHRKVVAAVPDGAEVAPVLREAAREAVSMDGRLYGLPISMKSVALYYRTDMVTGPPDQLENLRQTLRAPLGAASYPLAYASASLYFHAPFLHAFGGRVLSDDDDFQFVGSEAEASLRFVHGLIEDGTVPASADGALVTQLFSSGKAPFAISGPWLASELPDGLPYAVAPLPIIGAAGEPMAPFLTVESVFFTPDGAASPRAAELGRYLFGTEASILRRRDARVVPARRDLPPSDDAFVAAFEAQADTAVPMPKSMAGQAVFEPADKALKKVLNGTMGAAEALAEAEFRFDDVQRPPPEPASTTPALLILGALMSLAALAMVKRARDRSFRAEVRRSLPAYRYVVHAVVALGVLVFLPLSAGAAISLFAGPPDEQYFVGLHNFWLILTARGGPLLANGSFYLVLLTTIAWTLINVFFHVSIGLLLGTLLARPTLRFKGFYRVLLIVPWAVPNYVTALAWKGMFHQQFGAVTAFQLKLAGLLGMNMEPIAWFSRFSTAFTANIATNVWLGFPFMMVVTIAALTSVPKDVLEAAKVDGASRWQRFRLVTLPIIRPNMLPAVVLGSVWTFNMFNVVFLVSGGEPDGSTDILVSEAYRWAFTRQAQYGYAAAYAVLIFLLLFGGTRLPAWIKSLRQRSRSVGEDEPGPVGRPVEVKA